MTRLPIRLSILILFALFLAACGARQTPSVIVLTDAPTRTAFPTRTVTPSPGLFTAIHLQVTYMPTKTPRTPDPTSTPGPPTSTFAPTLPPATPATGPEGYRLREWDFQEAQLAISKADGILQQWDWTVFDEANRRAQFEKYFITIGQETVRRFPRDAATTGLYWKLGYYETASWNLTYPVEDFRLALETSLNSGDMAFSQLEDRLKQYGYFLSVQATYITTNLFGDGQTAVIFQVATFDQKSATFILTGSKPGDYRVSVPHENWFSTYHEWETISVTDLNGNGQPEIQRIHWSAWNMFCYSQLALYEWHGPHLGGQFVDLAQNIPASEVEGPDYYECAERWKAGPADANGAQLVISVFDHYYGDKDLKCADDEYQVSYRWNGTFYEWAGQSINPDSNAHSLVCAALWANWAGGLSNEAVDFMVAALDNWPTEIDRIFGATAQDDFRFKLGTWYALRGETELAQNTLQMVRDHPANLQSNKASQIAQAFLLSYESDHNPFLACHAAIQTLEALQPEVLDYANWFNSWPYGVCDMPEALRQTAITFQPQTTADFLTWCNEQGIGVSIIKLGDMTNDGVDDWLTVINTRRRPSDWDLWAFIPSQSGLQAIQIEDAFGQTNGSFATLTQISVETTSRPINVFKLGNWLVPFQFAEQAGEWTTILYPDLVLPREYQPPLYDHEKLALAEKTLFQSGDGSKALTLLEELRDIPTVDQGHVLYLLGLAHELSGHEREAVQAYWQLWRDYPDSPYTLIARRKLEVRGP